MTSEIEGMKRGSDFIPDVAVQCLSIQSKGMRQVNRKGEEEVGHSPVQWESSTVINCSGWLQMSQTVKARKDACSLPEISCSSCLAFLASCLGDWKSCGDFLLLSLVLIM